MISPPKIFVREKLTFASNTQSSQLVAENLDNHLLKLRHSMENNVPYSVQQSSSLQNTASFQKSNNVIQASKINILPQSHKHIHQPSVIHQQSTPNKIIQNNSISQRKVNQFRALGKQQSSDMFLRNNNHTPYKFSEKQEVTSLLQHKKHQQHCKGATKFLASK